MHIGDIEQYLEAEGVVIRGDNPRSVLQSALNRQQGMFGRISRGTWAWKPWSDAGTNTVSGRDLEDAAHIIARSMDPLQKGFHYEDLKVRLLGSSINIKGPNQGQTLRRVLQTSSRFRMLIARKGIWTWL